jgi:dihydrofolate reductase
MRKIIVTQFVTVDGVIDDPGGSEKTRHGGWSFQFGSQESGKYKFDELFASGALLLGRVTYEGFAAAWPAMRNEYADKMNGLPKFVVSTTLKNVAWNNSQVIRGNIPEEVARLKQQPGQDILIFGSVKLVNALMPHDLIDEYRLMVHPIVLGSGRRLFEGEAPDALRLRLSDTKTFPSGVVVLAYEPAGRNASA